MMNEYGDNCVIASKDIHKSAPILFIPEKLITTIEQSSNECEVNNWLTLNPKVLGKIKRKE